MATVVLTGCEARQHQVGFMTSDPFAPGYGTNAGTASGAPIVAASAAPTAAPTNVVPVYGPIGGAAQPNPAPPKATGWQTAGIGISKFWGGVLWVIGALLWLFAFFAVLVKGAWEARKLPFAVVMVILLILLIWAGDRLMS